MNSQPKPNYMGAFKQAWVVVTTAMFVVMLVGMSPVALATPAETTPCSDDEVTVLVDGFGAGCAPPGGNGYETLRAAGFEVEVTQKFPDFVCRINGSPGAEVDKCLTASPADAYWSYWHAPLGASEWTYSNNGAFTRSPAAGTVEAWVWGAGKEPGAVPVSQSQKTHGERSQLPRYNADTADVGSDDRHLEGSATTGQDTEGIMDDAQTATNPSEDHQIQPYAGPSTGSSDQTGQSSPWTVVLSIVAIVLVSAAAIVTWVIRRQEVSG